ncbi:MAG: hypothetical protein WBC13_05780 [Dokdonella sp.]
MEKLFKTKINIFNNVFITGKAGVGKTTFAMEQLRNNIGDFIIENGYAEQYDTSHERNLGKYRCESREDIKYVTFSDITIAKQDRCTRAMYLEALLTPKLLIVDDYRAAFQDASTIALMLDVLDRRSRKCTIVISNLSVKEISENIDDRIASRLSAFYIIDEAILGVTDHRTKARDLNEIIIQ